MKKLRLRRLGNLLKVPELIRIWILNYSTNGKSQWYNSCIKYRTRPQNKWKTLKLPIYEGSILQDQISSENEDEA